MIKALRPTVIKLEPVVTPLCDAVVSDQEGTHGYNWRVNNYGKRDPDRDPLLCRHHSVVRVGKKHYCRRHASALALQMWLRGELVEKKDA